MTTLRRAAVAAVIALSLAATANTANAQTPPPEPLPMGVPYVYQYGNPYWFQPIVPSPSPYPFGATRPIFGRYSWDYGVFYPVGPWSVYYRPTYLSPYGYSGLPSRVWMGYGW
jgi:hypothetical protein